MARIHFPKQIEYSDKYQDDLYEYRHVVLTKDAFKIVRGRGLLDEYTWRSIGVQ